MSSFCLPYAIQCAERATRVEAANVQERMKRGVMSLASISATAALFGFLGTVVGLIHLFQSTVGPKRSGIDLIASPVSEAMTPGFLGLSVALVAFWFHCYLRGQLRRFDLEMKAATEELIGHLMVCRPMVHRNGVPELVCPRFVTSIGRDDVLNAPGWICAVCGVIGFALYSGQHRLLSGLVVFSFLAYAGWLMKRQTVASAAAVFGFFAAILVMRLFSPFSPGAPELFLALASVLLAASLRPERSVLGAKRHVRIIRSLVLAALCVWACGVVSVGVIFEMHQVLRDESGIYPAIREGDWVVGWISPPALPYVRRPLGYFGGRLILAWSPSGGPCGFEVRVCPVTIFLMRFSAPRLRPG